jgi:hypothetical protein
MGVLMLGVMPLVFNGVMNLCRGLINNASVWMVASLGFSTAIVLFAAGVTALLIFLLVVLASQHG